MSASQLSLKQWDRSQENNVEKRITDLNNGEALNKNRRKKAVPCSEQSF